MSVTLNELPLDTLRLIVNDCDNVTKVVLYYTTSTLRSAVDVTQLPEKYRTYYYAIKTGNLKIVAWCKENIHGWNSDTCIHAAARGGYLDILLWCIENGDEWFYCNTPRYLKAAIKSGCLEVVKWCRGRGAKWNHKSCYYAAERGYLDILRWCVEDGSTCGMGVCFAALNKGHTGISQWLRDSGTCKCGGKYH